MNHSFLSLIFILCLSHTLLGQDNKPKAINASLYAFDYQKGLKKVFFQNEKSEIQEVSLSRANIRGPHKVKLNDASELVLLTEDGVDDEGEKIYKSVGKFKIAADMNEALVVLTPKGKKGYSGWVINSNITKFPKGMYQMINFSADNIRGLVGKTKVISPPKEIVSFAAANNAAGVMPVQFQYFRDGKWKSFSSSRWPRKKNERQLICVYQDPSTKRMKMRGLVLKKIVAPKVP